MVPAGGFEPQTARSLNSVSAAKKISQSPSTIFSGSGTGVDEVQGSAKLPFGAIQ